jgi:hypothetical protein
MSAHRRAAFNFGGDTPTRLPCDPDAGVYVVDPGRDAPLLAQLRTDDPEVAARMLADAPAGKQAVVIENHGLLRLGGLDE